MPAGAAVAAALGHPGRICGGVWLAPWSVAACKRRCSLSLVRPPRPANRARLKHWSLRKISQERLPRWVAAWAHEAGYLLDPSCAAAEAVCSCLPHPSRMTYSCEGRLPSPQVRGTMRPASRPLSGTQPPAVARAQGLSPGHGQAPGAAVGPAAGLGARSGPGPKLHDHRPRPRLPLLPTCCPPQPRVQLAYR